MKFPWTRDRKEHVRPSELSSDAADPDFRRDPGARVVALPTAEPLSTVPFNLKTCTLGDPPTEDEQAALNAHLRACHSWEEFWERAPTADWMLDALRGQWDSIGIAPERQLRMFALRCLDGLHGSDHAGLQELVQAVRRRVDGNATLCELAALQDRKRAFVVPGGVQGLPRCSPNAAGALAAWHTAGRTPYEAAFWSAEFAARHDAFVELTKAAASWAWPGDRGEPWRVSWRTAFFAKAHPAVQTGALSDARRRQADLLRSLLPQPFAQFGPPVRGDVYLGQENDAEKVAIYCRRCGVERGGATPGVLFDIRRTKCACCGVPIARLIS